MTTIARPYLALAAAVLLVLGAPAAFATGDAASPEAGLARAQALFDAGRFDEALAELRPLTAGREIDAGAAFLLGLAAIEASRRGATDAERDALLDEAIAVLRAMLAARPDLVRVRLELARAFFYKEEDGLARDHFERVLAGDVPESVAANVQDFLLRMRARRRWTAYLGLAIAPDSNIGSGSDEEIIYIHGLPFVRDNPDELTTSGVGVSVWTGGEYHHPAGDRLRLRAGADLRRSEYPGGEFDETHLALHAGPRWLIGPRTEASVDATARRRWTAGTGDYDAGGARAHVRRVLGPRVSANVRGSWERRMYRDQKTSDGPVYDLSLGGAWTITPVLRTDATFGYSRERPERRDYRNASRRLRGGVSAILPRGFNVGGSVQVRSTDYEGDWSFYTRGPPREDLTRTLSVSVFKRDFTLYGFAPQLVVTHEERTSTAQIHDYERTRGELRFVHQF